MFVFAQTSHNLWLDAIDVYPAAARPRRLWAVAEEVFQCIAGGGMHYQAVVGVIDNLDLDPRFWA